MAQTFDIKAEHFLSFDGGVSADGRLARPSQSALRELSDIEEKVLNGKPRITRGAGLSLAACNFGDNIVTIDNSRFNEIIEYDEQSGQLEVQAGANLALIYNFLLDKQRFLLTQPSYPAISIGGSIAADAHGKNQFRDGNFRHQVKSLKLFHPTRGVISASPEINREIFDLTCGGHGLTGHIISARLATQPLLPLIAWYRVSVDNIFEMPELLEKAALQCDFVSSWHDFSASGAAFARGFLLIGNFIDQRHNKRLKPEPLPTFWPLNGAGKGINSFCRLPCYSLPFNRLLNVLYGGINSSAEPRITAASEGLFPKLAQRKLYYDMFGGGFHETQMLVPIDQFPSYVKAIKTWLSQNEVAVTLASARFFKGPPSLLRFEGDGICFTLNFPRCEGGGKFIDFLDSLANQLGLIPNMVKDSRLPLVVVKNAYQHYDLFNERLRRFDPDRLYRSELSNRLEL